MLSRGVLPRKTIAFCSLLVTFLSGCDPAESEKVPVDTFDLSEDASMRCNGHVELCSKRLNEVAFAATHNSMSNADAQWWAPNQQHGLSQQMADGVRGMLLDSYDVDGELRLCHGFCELGSQLLSDGLGEIHTFLEDNPHEVMILFFQDGVGSEGMSKAFRTSGLAALAYTHRVGESFPTLGEMIEAGTRVLLASESDGPPPEWYHDGWALFFDTPYSFKGIEDFSCTRYRGDDASPLFLLNHWISDPSGLPSSVAADEANSYPVLTERALRCAEEQGQIPNLIAVDFYASGDLMAVVNSLNGVKN